MRIKWSKLAVSQLTNALDFIITEGFLIYAVTLEESILSKVENLISHPHLYSLDQFKINNDGSYYAFTVDEYRISFRVKDDEVRIIRARHTSKKVKLY